MRRVETVPVIKRAHERRLRNPARTVNDGPTESADTAMPNMGRALSRSVSVASGGRSILGHLTPGVARPRGLPQTRLPGAILIRPLRGSQNAAVHAGFAKANINTLRLSVQGDRPRLNTARSLLVNGSMRKMIIAGVLALGVLFIVVAVVGIERHLQRSAIISALQSRQKSRSECIVVAQTGFAPRTPLIRKADFLAALKRINTEGCPEPFRQAWLEYVQAWERFVAPSEIEKQEDILTLVAVKGKLEGNGNIGGGFASGLNAGAGGSVEADLSNLKDMAKRLEPRDPNEAFRRVEVVSLSYGVDALKWE